MLLIFNIIHYANYIHNLIYKTSTYKLRYMEVTQHEMYKKEILFPKE